MFNIRHAHERGQANLGWLQSKHSFSFGHYYDPQHMGFSALRVINDDLVKPGAGFAPHSHHDMEIISYVLAGSIEHKDSAGHVQQLPAGEFQLMSAGRGISHSEYNVSGTDELRFLQIWIQPNSLGDSPTYQQKDFGKQPGFTTIATPTGANGAFQIKQDATLYQLILTPGAAQTLSLSKGRKLYVHQVEGKLTLKGNSEAVALNPGDGIGLTEINAVEFHNPSNQSLTALVFDLP